MVYSMGTTDEKSNIPNPDRMDHSLQNRHHPERITDKKNDIGIDYEDREKGYGSEDHSGEGEVSRGHKFKRFYRHYKLFIHLVIVVVFTGSGFLDIRV